MDDVIYLATGSSIPPEYSRRIYDILVATCGACSSNLERESFVYAYEKGCTEYRFQGRLGFGGKFWNNAGRWYVTCYREDETPERLEMLTRANTELAQLKDGP